MPLVIGFLTGVMATLGTGAIRRERARQRAQVQAWDKEWAQAYANQAAAAEEATVAPAPAGPRPGESFAFRVPTQERPVVVDAVVVDRTAGGGR